MAIPFREAVSSCCSLVCLLCWAWVSPAGWTSRRCFIRRRGLHMQAVQTCFPNSLFQGLFPRSCFQLTGSLSRPFSGTFLWLRHRVFWVHLDPETENPGVPKLCRAKVALSADGMHCLPLPAPCGPYCGRHAGENLWSNKSCGGCAGMLEAGGGGHCLIW